MPSSSRLRAAFAAPRPAHRAFLFAGGLILLFLAVQLAPASTPNLPPETTASDSYETARPQHDGIRLFSAGNLLALAFLAGGGVWALYLRKRTARPGNAPALFESVGQMQIAAGQQLRLVRCGGEVLLLGVTSAQITLLRRYPADAFDADPELASEDTPMPPGFADLLRTSLGRSAHA